MSVLTVEPEPLSQRLVICGNGFYDCCSKYGCGRPYGGGVVLAGHEAPAFDGGAISAHAGMYVATAMAALVHDLVGQAGVCRPALSGRRCLRPAHIAAGLGSQFLK